MPTVTGLDGGMGVPAIKRQLDPRTSITGKLVGITAAMIAVSAVVIGVMVWLVTTRIVTTVAGAQLVLEAGVVAGVAIAAGQLIGAFVLRQSIVGGLTTLEQETRSIVDSGGLETGVETDRTDEIGQLAWRIAELREQLVKQVETVESLNRDLASAATAHSKTLAACRNGDLTQRMDAESDVPQFDALATNFNEMMTETETMVAEVRSFSQSVADAAVETAESASEIDRAAETVTDATGSISDGVSHQHERTERTAAAMADLTDDIDAIDTEAATVTDHSVDAMTTTEAGVEAAEDALAELESIRGRTDEAVAEFEQLTQLVDDVGEITERISELASWIDQLAVNTQIASAKTADGDTEVLGKRIKRVASDTDEAVTVVEQLAASIDEQTADAQAELEATEAAIDNGAETIEAALHAFTEIETAIERTTNGVTEIDEATKTQAARTADIREDIDEVRQVADRTATEAEAAERAAKSQLDAVDGITTRLSWLSQTAADLETHLEQFTVRSQPASAEPRRSR